MLIFDGRAHCPGLPERIAKMSDLELLRPLYLACGMSGVCLLTDTKINSEATKLRIGLGDFIQVSLTFSYYYT